MASRNKERAAAAIKELKEQTGKEAIFLQIELTSLASVKRAATEFLRCGWISSIPGYEVA